MPNENDPKDRIEMGRGGEQGMGSQGSNGSWNRDENRPASVRAEGRESNPGREGGSSSYSASGGTGGGGGEGRIEMPERGEGREGSGQSTEGSGTEQPRRKQRRGFAAMDPAKQKEIASKGGKASHEQGTGHEWDSESAREAGRKGGQASRGGRGKIPSGGGGGAST